jgi:predicted glycosyltransferase
LICTPTSFLHNLGKRHHRYQGFHELAYLHPDYFTPDPGVLKDLGIHQSDPFILLRFVAWKATHDMGQRGFSLDFKENLIRKLSPFGRVFISSEAPLPANLEPFRINLPPHKIHHVLYYAALFMGEGATMASEAAILGTPAVYSSSLALNMGNFIELMNRYQLVLSYCSPREALETARQLLRENNIKEKWMRRRDRMLADKIDVTQYVVELLENYPV